MHRAQPVANKLCAQKNYERSYEIHKKKLQTTKASVDNRAPKEYNHLRKNMKKIQVESEYVEKVRKENQILLDKMTDIMQKSTVDNNNGSVKFFHSLNKEQRKRELMKITAENMAILKRIQDRQPNYNHLQWEQDRKRNEKYCKNICQYNYQKGVHRDDLKMKRKDNVINEQEDDEELLSREEELLEQYMNDAKGYNIDEDIADESLQDDQDIIYQKNAIETALEKMDNDDIDKRPAEEIQEQPQEIYQEVISGNKDFCPRTMGGSCHYVEGKCSLCGREKSATEAKEDSLPQESAATQPSHSAPEVAEEAPAEVSASVSDPVSTTELPSNSTPAQEQPSVAVHTEPAATSEDPAVAANSGAAASGEEATEDFYFEDNTEEVVEHQE